MTILRLSAALCRPLHRPSLFCYRELSTKSRLPRDGLSFHDFMQNSSPTQSFERSSNGARFHLKTYGCQMNVNDSDIVRSLLLESGFQETDTEEMADVLLTNTCAIREGAEQRVIHRLKALRATSPGRIVGVLGCMAERLQSDLVNRGLADVVVGPDAYRELARLLKDRLSDDLPIEDAVQVELSLHETYADIHPVRRRNDISAFVSIQRGCSNRCSFCIVPFTRGQERSRPLESIVQEIQQLHDQGVKEVILLGQNVNSYHDTSHEARQAQPETIYSMSNDGFRSRIRRSAAGYFFGDLLARVSDISPELRVRFTSPHPKDYPPELLQLMADRANICNHLHLPAQSGSTEVLRKMKRGYSREAYLQLIDDIHSVIPDVAISSDFIAGFCDETETDHAETLSLIEAVRYDQAYLFAYSMREKTHAHRTMQDNVAEEVKQRRLRELIDTFRKNVHEKNVEREVGRFRLVLVEGESKRSRPDAVAWTGRTDQNKRIIFTLEEQARSESWSPCTTPGQVLIRPGEYAVIQVTEAKGHTLRGKFISATTLVEFNQTSGLPGAPALQTVLEPRLSYRAA